jgi:hypothetical protein
MVIPYAMRTHQGDPLGGELFALVHFKALCSTINCYPSCLFLQLYYLHINIFKLNFVR